ncbi:MAG: MoaD/ThiS family protein [Myxococcota bacterium]|nr:MoaD/ThiS family protein [Myxococcota bacterium]
MSVTVQFTYDMAKEIGKRRIEVSGAKTVGDVLRLTREQFPRGGEPFEKLTRVAALAVNGVLVTHRKVKKTAVRDGDRVAFVKAAAGG